MRTKIQNKRLLKLIEFLEKLPRKKFDFAVEVGDMKTNGHQCATVACALGWTPAVFPRQIKWKHWRRDTILELWTGDYELLGERIEFCGLASKFFGCSSSLFVPEEQSYVDKRLADLSQDATPKQVAKMLRKYMKLVP